MIFFSGLRILTLFAVSMELATAQRYKLVINAETPEGQLLQSIGAENDPAKKLELLEKFASTYPKHDGAAWVYSQLVPAYISRNEQAKAADAVDKLLAIDPGDLEVVVALLKGYENVSDPAAVTKWSGIASKLAREQLAKPKPSDEEAAKELAAAQDYAKQVDAYADYAMFNQAAKAKDPQQGLALTNELEKRSPQSPYLAQSRNATFLALRQAGQIDQAVTLADKAIAQDPNNEEMLLVAADYYMKKQQSDKVLTYSTKLVEVMNVKQKPEQMSDADWTKRKGTLMGAGNWMAGVTYATQNKFVQADKVLRDALPLLTDEQMKAAALFHLGVANFRLGETSGSTQRITDALRYSQQCSAIKSPYAANAAKNVAAIRSKYKITGK